MSGEMFWPELPWWQDTLSSVLLLIVLVGVPVFCVAFDVSEVDAKRQRRAGLPPGAPPGSRWVQLPSGGWRITALTPAQYAAAMLTQAEECPQDPDGSLGLCGWDTAATWPPTSAGHQVPLPPAGG